MIVVRAEYVIGNLLIALAEKGICEVSVSQIYEFGAALQHGPFSDVSVFIRHNYQELVFEADQTPFFNLYKRETYYVRIAEGISLNEVKARYMGYMPPEVLAEIYQMARKMVHEILNGHGDLVGFQTILNKEDGCNNLLQKDWDRNRFGWRWFPSSKE